MTSLPLHTPEMKLAVVLLATPLFTLLLGWAASRVAQAGTRAVNPGRKLFHAGIFTGAVPVQLAAGFWGVVGYGAIVAALVALAAVLGDRFPLQRALARSKDGPGGRRHLILPLLATAAGGLLGVLLVGEYAVVGFLVCGWGDAAGELVGSRYGRRHYRGLWSGTSRTLEGSSAVLVMGGAGGWAGLSLLGAGPIAALGVGLLCGGVGAVAEGISSQGTDNLWVQLAPTLLAWWILG